MKAAGRFLAQILLITLAAILAGCTPAVETTPARQQTATAVRPAASQTIQRASTAPAVTRTETLATGAASPANAMIHIPIDSGHVNVRSGPGTTYPVIVAMQAGASTAAVGRLGEWIMVAVPNVVEGVGWVYAPLVAVTGELPDLGTPGSVQP